MIFGTKNQTNVHISLGRINGSALSLVALSGHSKDIVDTAVDAGNFKTLAATLTAAGLIDTLRSKGPYTVFAPTDAAFAKIPKADLDALLADKAKLTAVLTYHVVAGTVMAKDVEAGQIQTVQGWDTVIATSGGVMVNNAEVTATDMVADNGVIYVIDTVLLPMSWAARCRCGGCRSLLRRSSSRPASCGHWPCPR
jgi:uncharacterized surface protein with fasciclin (FAS1) repeats